MRKLLTTMALLAIAVGSLPSAQAVCAEIEETSDGDPNESLELQTEGTGVIVCRYGQCQGAYLKGDRDRDLTDAFP